MYTTIGWRGCLWIGIAPALVVIYVRKFVKEPPVWKENRDKQRAQNKEVRAPLIEMFRLRMLPNTLTACLWMASGFITYYTVFGLFATHLQKDLGFAPGDVALPIALANVTTFLSSCFFGAVSDKLGRRWAMIIPSEIRVLVTTF